MCDALSELDDSYGKFVGCYAGHMLRKKVSDGNLKLQMLNSEECATLFQSLTTAMESLWAAMQDICYGRKFPMET